MEIKKFAVIEGNAEVDVNSGIIKYKVMPKPTDVIKHNAEKRQFMRIRSDKTFSSGALQFKIKPTHAKTGIYLILKSEQGYNIFCGASYTDHRFVIAQEGNSSWKDLSSAGSIINYPLNTVISFEVRVLGSTVKLLVDDINICEATVSIKDSPIEFQLSSKEDFTLFDVQIIKSKPKIFVVMQFTEDYNQLYSDVIKPIVENEFDYECIRADDFNSSSPILKDIVDSILNSKAIIAEITPDNPNVFYEIGYSHAIGKPTILLCGKNRTKLPFDLSGFRTLFYENTISGKKKVENSLRQYLKNI